MQPQYPIEIIPKETDLIITSPSPEEWLCRCVPSDIFLVEADGSISGKAITYPKDPHLLTYSVNKIPPSKSEFVKFEIVSSKKNEFYANWVPGNPGKVPTPMDFEYKESSQYFVFQIGKLKVSGLYTPAKENAKYSRSFHFNLTILHMPTLCNFSHFSFEVKLLDDQGIDLNPKPNAKSPGMQIVYAEIRQALCKIGKREIDS
ncbi:hypothetical protein [Leptospira interrogans]|uniref:hypothetical protein n=1 Tax=Leptospira interrogans TaxID=173 RepID=UPI00077366FC|nr:hypothetical protein [Leptospira interrogans]